MRSAWLRIAATAVGLVSFPAVSGAGGLRQLRFSPDGRYVLAQDQSRVTVLTVRPLAVLFGVPAESATLAEFTPDSQQVVFVSSVPHADSRKLAVVSTVAHVERWSVAGHSRIAFTEMALEACESEGLSPDGQALACVDFHGTLRIIDVASGKTIFEKKKFGIQFVDYGVPTYEGGSGLNELSGDPGLARIDFSSDGHFLIATPLDAPNDVLAFDLNQKTVLKLQGDLTRLNTAEDFTFLGADRLLVGRVVLTFPSGQVVFRPPVMPDGELFRAADPRFVLIFPWGPWRHYSMVAKLRSSAVRPVVEYTPLADPGMGALELETGQAILTKNPPLDVYGNYYVAERTDGELGLYERGKGLQAAVKIDGR